jgi:hypothetical protein
MYTEINHSSIPGNHFVQGMVSKERENVCENMCVYE